MTTILPRALRLAVIVCIMSLAPLAAQAASDSSFNEEALTSSSIRPALTGETDEDRVRLIVENEKGKRVYKSGLTRVRDGEWKITIRKKLAAGEYEVTLVDRKNTELAQETLTLEKKSSSKKEKKTKVEKTDGSLSISSLPFLTGGTTYANRSVPVAYLKVSNAGKEAVAIEGFTLKQNGSADPSAVTSFSVNDDKGGSRATVDASFKKGEAFVPLATEIAPNSVRIYTIKANLGSRLASGSTLMLDAVGIETGASVKSKLPIRGTTWTLR
ncbi:MAG TPA: Ig-like domain-containing protein [Candidatus Paceibacterota bacterium]